MSLLENCKRIVELEDQIAPITFEIENLKLAVELETGMTYDEFIEGARRLMQPA